MNLNLSGMHPSVGNYLNYNLNSSSQTSSSQDEVVLFSRPSLLENLLPEIVKTHVFSFLNSHDLANTVIASSTLYRCLDQESRYKLTFSCISRGGVSFYNLSPNQVYNNFKNNMTYFNYYRFFSNICKNNFSMDIVK